MGLNEHIVEGFGVEIAQQLAESVEFAINAVRNDPGNEYEDSEETRRQVAQDALMELMPQMVEAVEEAYRKSPLKEPDWQAIDTIFKHLAIRAKLKGLSARVTDSGIHNPGIASVVTRSGRHTGRIWDIVTNDGQESLLIGSDQDIVPVIAITDVIEVV